MKWEFSTSYQGLGSKSPTVQRQLKQKGSRVIIEFDKVLSHSIILPPRLSKIILVNAHRASRQKYLEICQRLTYGLGFPSAIPGPSRRPRLGKSMVKYGAIWCNIVKLSTVQLPCTSTVHEYLRTRGPAQLQCSSSTQEEKTSRRTALQRNEPPGEATTAPYLQINLESPCCSWLFQILFVPCNKPNKHVRSTILRRLISSNLSA